MLPGNEQHERVPYERNDAKTRIGLGISDDGDVNPELPEVLEDLHRVADREGETDAGIPSVERGHDRHRVLRGVGADLERAADEVTGGSEQVARGRLGVEQAARDLEKRLPEIRGLGSPAPAREEPHAVLLLEMLDVRGDGRLADMEGAAGRREAALRRDRMERPQAPDVHSRGLYPLSSEPGLTYTEVGRGIADNREPMTARTVLADDWAKR